MKPHPAKSWKTWVKEPDAPKAKTTAPIVREPPPEKYGFLEGLRRSLGNESYYGLGKIMGLSESECKKLSALQRSQIGDVDYNECWVKFATEIDKLIAGLMAVRGELQKKLTADRKARALRRNRIEKR